MLTAHHISYSIDKKSLLKGFSASFKAGEIHLILGPNGAGKSTLIKLLSGQLQPSSGTIALEDKALSYYTLPQLAKFRAVLSQNIYLSFPMKVHEVVLMGRYPHFQSVPSKLDLQACEEAMEFFNISGLSQREYLTLSGGEKQRVHFARVLAQISHTQHIGNHYLFLDEPLTFLDIQYQYQLMHQLKKLLQKHPLIVIGVVHDLNLAAKFSNRLLLLHQGSLVAEGTPSEVLTKENIESVYQLTPTFFQQQEKLHLFFE